jgi:S-formylglutathione hydrolase
MYTYLTEELPAIVAQHFRVDMDRQGIFGHSMGGHGAMTIALKNPDRFKSCSAFAPIVEPMTADWSVDAFEKYLGKNQSTWRQYDACALVKDGARFPEFLIDQGKADAYLETGLRPWLFEAAIKGTGIDLTLNMHERYDHSYYFVSTFMNDHLKWHAERLGRFQPSTRLKHETEQGIRSPSRRLRRTTGSHQSRGRPRSFGWSVLWLGFCCLWLVCSRSAGLSD